jgi:hypothetical protein
VAARRRACPICGKPPVAAHRPFCSKRCADIDLGRWLGEVYRISAEEDDEPAGPEAFDETAAPPRRP